MRTVLLSLLLVLSMLTFGASSAIACCMIPPPTIEACGADPSTLWPPNHKMRDIDLTVTGSGFEPEDWYVSNVESFEVLGPCIDPDPFDDDDVCHVLNDPDWEYMGQDLALRSERTGEFGARLYRVYVTAYNDAGSDTETCDVMVPHDNSPGD